MRIEIEGWSIKTTIVFGVVLFVVSTVMAFGVDKIMTMLGV